MAKVTNILLLMLFVLSKYDSAEHDPLKDPEDARMWEIVIENMKQLWLSVENNEAKVAEVQRGTEDWLCRFRCNYKPCKRRPCTYEHNTVKSYKC